MAQPKNEENEPAPIIPPPATVVVISEIKPVLYLPNGRILTRRIGF